MTTDIIRDFVLAHNYVLCARINVSSFDGFDRSLEMLFSLPLYDFSLRLSVLGESLLRMDFQ